MSSVDFHTKEYDGPTLAKLRIFELYVQGWIPVFVSSSQPVFRKVHIYDFFSGPGTDSAHVYGSPLRILDQLRRYHQKGMSGWNSVKIEVHLFDRDPRKIGSLRNLLSLPEWSIPGVHVDCRALEFEKAFAEHQDILVDPDSAKLLIIDQFGVDAVSEPIFRRLISFPRTDFIFFLSSSTLHRFRNHPAIKQKIEDVHDSFDVHRAAVNYYRNLVPQPNRMFLGSFSIKKGSNIYGLIFGSQHPLGIHKFLKVTWDADEIAGEANFDIERENIQPGEGILNLEVMRPKKIQDFEERLEAALKAGRMRSEADIVRFCIESGMTCQHSAGVLKRLKGAGIIDIDFRVPDVRRFSDPRSVKVLR